MDALHAIELHHRWKDYFRATMAAKEVLNVAIIGSDLCCDLGEWLFSEGKKKFGHTEEWKNCVLAHADFHLEAAKIALKINDKCYLEADQMMSDGKLYSLKSSGFVLAVERLFELF
jgi:methyl-accepting chemotaxis protein